MNTVSCINNDNIRFDNIIYQNLFMIWTFLDVKDIATQFRYYMRYRLHANVSLSFFHAMIPVIVCIISHIPTQQQPFNIKEKNKHIDISIYKHIYIPMLYSQDIQYHYLYNMLILETIDIRTRIFYIRTNFIHVFL